MRLFIEEIKNHSHQAWVLKSKLTRGSFIVSVVCILLGWIGMDVSMAATSGKHDEIAENFDGIIMWLSENVWCNVLN